MGRQPRQATGFTLLELIVVLAIFGLFAVMAYGGLNYVLTSRKQLEASLDQIAVWQKAYQKLRNDFQLVSTRPARDGFGQAQPALMFTEYGSRVEFTHAGWRNPLFAPRASIERVVVRYDEKQHQLIRESYGAMDRARDDLVRKLVLIAGLSDASWRFMDSQRQWQTRWPPQAVNVTTAAATVDLPLAVELTLKGRDFSGVRWLFRLGETKTPVLAPAGTGAAPNTPAPNTPTPPTPNTPAPINPGPHPPGPHIPGPNIPGPNNPGPNNPGAHNPGEGTQ